MTNSVILVTPTARRYLPRSSALEDAVLSALRAGHSIDSTVRLLGVARSTLRNWRKDPAFADAFEKARIEGVENIVRDRLAKRSDRFDV